MKQTLLLVASLLIGAGVNAQFTESNASQIGDQETLFLLDSFATDYASEVGASATWDYSATTGYNSTTRTGEVKLPSTTANGGSFTSSEKAFGLEGLLMSYLTNDASGQKSQGFYMNDATAGELLAIFSTDEQDQYQYPMNLNDNFSDHYEGTFDLDNPLIGEVSGTIEGNVIVEIDGEGSLQLAHNTYSNVLRYKISDTFDLFFSVPPGIPLEIHVKRVQYEYYDFTVGRLPIFIHSSLNVTPPSGLGMAPTENTIVLSLEDPDGSGTVGLSSYLIEETLVYPNPATKELTVELPAAMKSANVVINDALGRTVYNHSFDAALNTIDVSQFNKGVYFVKINDGIQSTIKRIVVK